jgi:ABC-type polar amino acid transport system ATPase subunit
MSSNALSTGSASRPLLETRDLRLSRARREVLCGVDIQVGRGEIVALMGLSGSGKTTILRSIAGLESFDAGEIRIEEVSIGARTPTRQARRLLDNRVGMVFQFHYLFEHLSAVDNVSLAPVRVLGRPQPEAQTRAHQLLEQLGVAHRATALPRELSGGEAQRVAIARALAVDPPVLLLDEPTASLDPARRNELGDALVALGAEGRTLVMTSHDDEFVHDFASRVVVLADGCVVEEGDPSEVLTRPTHPATKKLLQVEREKKR